MSDPLQEQFFESDGVKVKRFLPWLNLFRAFRLAIGLRVLMLGILAGGLLSAGEYAISWLPFAPQMNQPTDDGDEGPIRTTWPWEPGFLIDSSEEDELLTSASIAGMAEDPGKVLKSSINFGHVILWPARTVIEPATVLFSANLNWKDAALNWCQLIWALLVWSALGVAIVRIVVLEFAGRESPSLSGSLKFSGEQLTSAIGSVILPSVALGGLYLACRIAGWLALVSWLRPVVAVFWIVDLLCGLGIAIILMLLAAGWPLMICTMAVDRGDAFEGFTRAFSYVFGRPWYALWLLLLTTLYGSVVFAFLVTIISSSAHLAEQASGGHAGIDQITLLTPSLIRTESVPVEGGELAAAIGGFWLWIWATLCVGFVASFFWTACGLSYLLLRKSVDATPLDEIHEADMQTRADALPLSGIAAAEQREKLAAAETPSTTSDEPQSETPSGENTGSTGSEDQGS